MTDLEAKPRPPRPATDPFQQRWEAREGYDRITIMPEGSPGEQHGGLVIADFWYRAAAQHAVRLHNQRLGDIWESIQFRKAFHWAISTVGICEGLFIILGATAEEPTTKYVAVAGMLICGGAALVALFKFRHDRDDT